MWHNTLTETTHNFCLTVDKDTMSPSPHVHNFGVISDSNLSFEQLVSQITRTAFFHLKNTAPTPVTFPSAAKTLIYAFVAST